MITTGVTGRSWRASITAWGGIVPWGDAAPLDWFVAADDRWHVPARESTVRQRRIEGTPVVETRVRVPNGDVVQRVVSVADHGGLTVVEVENESTLPVAIAFDRRDVLTERPIADIPIDGIELAPGAFVMPLAHTATIRVAIPHDGRSGGRVPSGLPTTTQIVRGWLALTERASRFVLPDPSSSLATRVTAERCEVVLGTIPAAADDPARFAVALGELVRMGERPEPWLPELVDAVASIGPRAGWDGDVALAAAARTLWVAEERRALRDLRRIRADRAPSPRPTDVPDDLLVVPWLESRLATGGTLLPDGLPDGWLGRSFEVYGLPTTVGSSVSYALRWHGDRPAVLWEQVGEPIELSAPAVAPGWSSSDATGEALWPPPPGEPPARAADLPSSFT